MLCFFSRDSLTDAFGDKDNGDYRKSPAPEDDMLSAGGAHQRPSGKMLSSEKITFFLTLETRRHIVVRGGMCWSQICRQFANSSNNKDV